MKLKMTAAAVLALGSGMVCSQTAPEQPAAAQPSVTVYGALDVGVSMQSTSAAGYAPTANTTNTGAISKLQDGGIGGSNFGLKGSTDVGGGLKANFQLQGNINMDTGAGNAISGTYPGPGTALFNQMAKVGFSGSYGEISLGRQITPLYMAMAFTDGREGRFSGSILSSLVGMNSAAGWNGTTTNVPLGAIYDDNSIVYTTPTMNGFTGNLQYTMGEKPGNGAAASRRSATLLYAGGGLKLSAAYYAANDAYTSVANANGTLNNQLYHLGAKYDLSAYTFSASYTSGKNPSGIAPTATAPANAASANSDYSVVHVGLGYKISPQYRITSGYYHLKDNNNTDNKSGLLAVGLDRYFDAKTMVYVQAGYVKNEGAMNQAIIYGAPVAGGEQTIAYMVGVRRSF